MALVMWEISRRTKVSDEFECDPYELPYFDCMPVEGDLADFCFPQENFPVGEGMLLRNPSIEVLGLHI